LDEARAVAAGHTLVPVSMELFADTLTPIRALYALRGAGSECFLLESAPGGENWGRYTFLGFDPKLTVRGDADGIEILSGATVTRQSGDTHTLLREFTARSTSPRLAYLPPMTGGLVGYVSYEHMCRVEKSLRLNAVDDVGYDDFRLMLFDKVIAFDAFRQKIVLIINVETADLERNYIDGVTKLKDLERLLLGGSRETPPEPRAAALGAFHASKSKSEFVEAVKTAKRHIFEGDIFQCVPSLRFDAPYGGDLLDAYRVLRTVNPSAYMFYVKFEDLQLAGASPETLVSLRDGVATTYPLAGTCPRVEDDDETERLIAAMLSDEKELAEHDMLVDLGRNDLGKVCKFGTVRVAEYRAVKRLSHVCHIASKVTGAARDDTSALDVLAATLPAGTLSGAPKKRACEIIDTLEGLRRGAYGGAVGYIDFTGNMDFCIGIRMAALKNERVYVQAGAGIVSDSDPAREYDECVRKASAMMGVLAINN
jgi:anthranilate synthase component 1